jgi:hypothetical protein
METIKLDQLTETTIKDYLENNCLVKYEKAMLNEMLEIAGNNDTERLNWFASFGKTIRHITMNVYAYRRGLDFGFTTIAFDQYGWYVRPQFLEYENIKLGIVESNNNYSEIRIGRGVNHVWTYGISYSYGTAGGGSNISVYDKPFADREAALNSALKELKEIMQSKVGDTDTTNYKQATIAATLKAITEYKYKDLQMTLF